MNQQPNGPVLAAVFVDYDNIYLSLRRKSEEAAKRFSKDAGFWIKEITSGALISPTNGFISRQNRRLVMARCYGNPVPRRNTTDNSTDMNSFPFVRHHFLRGGFEVIDCPPLTAQLKNSADIRMVMDMRDLLNHDTYYDEFIILSSDADFTPMLHRLRAHARHTVIYANDYTAAPYTAICDGEVREADLIRLLLEGRSPSVVNAPASTSVVNESQSVINERIRDEIIMTVVNAVRSSEQPVPLEALAERTTRALGHDQTVGSSWGGAGSFLDLLRKELPAEVQLTSQAPYLAFDARRVVTAEAPRAAPVAAPEAKRPVTVEQPVGEDAVRRSPIALEAMPVAAGARATDSRLVEREARAPRPSQAPTPVAAATGEPAPTASVSDSKAEALQTAMARIRDASQVPVLSPSDYRKLFVAIAQEINENNLQGAQTISNIMARAAERNVEVRRDDVRFILEVVSEADPWFEQGASANLFAGRFHNFVVARCRSQGLDLAVDDLDLIEAWFAGNGEPIVAPRPQHAREVATTPRPPVPQSKLRFEDEDGRDDFPRILQNRRRG